MRGNPKELEALYSDMLINVTSFFRNPGAFEVLKEKVFPKLIQQHRFHVQFTPTRLFRAQ